MALSDAEKQARWRERNMVSLTDRANDIAARDFWLIDVAR